ncbi:MAG: acetyl-CoA carboxylase biotin carboxyl carrier protein [Planctomycetota bacterium]|nr:acetyl-CoA carboxylase biotin carboxyl carrier protein [Planctomycetota bacterium]
MDIDRIKELVRLMVDNDLAELDVSDGENKVKLKRGAGYEPVVVAAPAPVAPVAGQAEKVEPAAVEENIVEIKSPMVGTYYSAEGPDSEPYVSIGSGVGKDTVVCLIEAMKVMNEIKADCAGTISEICVKNAQPVEYGQVLFKIKPS